MDAPASRELPDSARLAWWLTAVLGGSAAPDDLVAGLLDEDPDGDGDVAHDVTGLPGHDGSVPLVVALGALRRAGATAAGLALPVDGDPVGLGGPPDFNRAALVTGEAVVLLGSGLGLVPTRAGRGVVWRCLPAERRPLVDVGEADRALRLALVSAATDLAALDVARWRPEVADALLNLRHRPQLEPPPGTPPVCGELAGRGLQALGITDLALADDGGSVTVSEADLRRAALRDLARAGRRAVVAACSPEVWPER